MAKLENSTRRVLQATYAQVALKDGPEPFRATRPLLKTGLVLAGKPAAYEVATIRDQIAAELREPGADVVTLDEQLATLDALDEIVSRPGRTVDIEQVTPTMSTVGGASLAALSDRLVRLRDQRATTAVSALAALVEAYERARGGGDDGDGDPPRTRAALPDGFSVVDDAGTPRAVRVVTEPGPGSPAGTDSEGHAIATGARTHTEVVLLATADRADAPVTRAAAPTPTLQQLADWAAREPAHAAQAQELVSIARSFGYDTAKLSTSEIGAAFSAQVEHSRAVVQAFKKQADVEPVGFLHLERISFSPDGIERGELVYSLPLAPGEEVSLEHKEWATTTEEFERITTESLEEFSEEGVTETSELAQSTNVQTQHSMGLNTNVTASGGFGPVNVTSSVGLSINDSASKTAEYSRNQSMAVTRKASTRSQKEHKVSFKVVTTSGTQDQTVRTIKNPYPDKATRVDYYQLIRKWEVNVHRYGIRLTYDITIPEPGSDVLGKIKQIEDLTSALQQGFGGDATASWARFDLAPAQITRANYANLAAEYNATVPIPPIERIYSDQARTHEWADIDDAGRRRYHVLEVDIDPEYEIDQVTVDQHAAHYLGESFEFEFQPVDDFIGKSGKRQLAYWTKFISSAYVELRVSAKLRTDVLREWQLKAWAAMRDSAQSRYYEMRVMLKEQLSQLQEELGAQDALSLRKFEREEIMKGVQRWLFGPDFEFIPPGVSADLYDGGEAVKTNKVWKEMLQHGELIKFLHHAIEWENVLYILYPYFWSHVSRWEMKKFLNHPDPTHQAFLKAGSARVVLTIRPGFERAFVSLLESGSMKDALPSNHPYMTIIKEMEAYAATHYPGIPPADPDGADTAEAGELIGTWHEYTPTSALDIAFGETLPSA